MDVASELVWRRPIDVFSPDDPPGTCEPVRQSCDAGEQSQDAEQHATCLGHDLLAPRRLAPQPERVQGSSPGQPNPWRVQMIGLQTMKSRTSMPSPIIAHVCMDGSRHCGLADTHAQAFTAGTATKVAPHRTSAESACTIHAAASVRHHMRTVLQVHSCWCVVKGPASIALPDPVPQARERTRMWSGLVGAPARREGRLRSKAPHSPSPSAVPWTGNDA